MLNTSSGEDLVIGDSCDFGKVPKNTVYDVQNILLHTGNSKRHEIMNLLIFQIS